MVSGSQTQRSKKMQNVQKNAMKQLPNNPLIENSRTLPNAIQGNDYCVPNSLKESSTSKSPMSSLGRSQRLRTKKQPDIGINQEETLAAAIVTDMLYKVNATPKDVGNKMENKYSESLSSQHEFVSGTTGASLEEYNGPLPLPRMMGQNMGQKSTLHEETQCDGHGLVSDSIVLPNDLGSICFLNGEAIEGNLMSGDSMLIQDDSKSGNEQTLKEMEPCSHPPTKHDESKAQDPPNAQTLSVHHNEVTCPPKQKRWMVRGVRGLASRLHEPQLKCVQEMISGRKKRTPYQTASIKQCRKMDTEKGASINSQGSKHDSNLEIGGKTDKECNDDELPDITLNSPPNLDNTVPESVDIFITDEDTNSQGVEAKSRRLSSTTIITYTDETVDNEDSVNDDETFVSLKSFKKQQSAPRRMGSRSSQSSSERKDKLFEYPVEDTCPSQVMSTADSQMSESILMRAKQNYTKGTAEVVKPDVTEVKEEPTDIIPDNLHPLVAEAVLSKEGIAPVAILAMKTTPEKPVYVEDSELTDSQALRKMMENIRRDMDLAGEWNCWH